MKKQKNLLLSAGVAACSLLAFTAAAQPWYGQLRYKHDSTILSSAKRTFQNPGYVMAGFRPVTATSANFNFVIDKVSGSGTFLSTTTDFSKIYRVFVDPINCTSPTQIQQCTGVSIIETKNQGQGETYAIAGEYGFGIFFATLDVLGNIINQNFWAFPSNPGNNRKPQIRESVAQPGRYYICGTTGGASYVIKVNSTGAQMWGESLSQPSIEARDLIESPYNGDELIVVGRTDIQSADALFMSLKASTGAFNYLKYYNFPAWLNEAWFASIEIANSPTGGNGYVLGGRSLGPGGPPPTPSDARYIQWMCKLDQNGNIVWSTLIKPVASVFNLISGGEVEHVLERLDPNTSQYEYYGVAGSNYDLVNGAPSANPNLVVYKLDDFGKDSHSPDEFHYISGGYAPAAPSANSPYNFCDLTLKETGGGNDDGLQAYCSSLTQDEHYFAKAYFNGVSGCKDQQLDIDSIFAGPSLVGILNNINLNQISNCNINIQAINVNTPISPVCYANSVAGGSNARLLGITKASGQSAGISVYPNPVSSKANVSIPLFIKGTVTVVVLDNLGRQVQSQEYSQGGEYAVDFDALGVKSGLYFIQVTAGSLKSSYKVIYDAK